MTKHNGKEVNIAYIARKDSKNEMNQCKKRATKSKICIKNKIRHSGYWFQMILLVIHSNLHIHTQLLRSLFMVLYLIPLFPPAHELPKQNA